MTCKKSEPLPWFMRVFFFMVFSVGIVLLTANMDKPTNQSVRELMDGTPVLVVGSKGDYLTVVPRVDSLPNHALAGQYAVHVSLLKPKDSNHE